MSVNPLEQIQGIAGEHFHNYVIIVVHPEHHELEYVHDNIYAARGLLDVVKQEIVDTPMEDTVDIDWDEAWRDEIDDEDSEF